MNNITLSKEAWGERSPTPDSSQVASVDAEMADADIPLTQSQW